MTRKSDEAVARLISSRSDYFTMGKRDQGMTYTTVLSLWSISIKNTQVSHHCVDAESLVHQKL